jgi:hypothetical protein
MSETKPSEERTKVQKNLPITYGLKQKTVDTAKIFGVCIFIVMGIYMVQAIGYSFQKYVIENDKGLNSQVLMGVFDILVWGFIIFIIVMVSPPFRKFFFKMFGSNPEESETEK